MNPPIFIDTSGWIALFCSQDALFVRANEWINLIKQRRIHTVTSTAVLVEVLDGFAQHHLLYLGGILRHTVEHSSLEVVDADRSAIMAAWEFYEKRTDKTWGITDCSSFLIMEEKGMTDALTYDIHFAQAGFRPLLRETP